jgi:hypothetical protein
LPKRFLNAEKAILIDDRQDRARNQVSVIRNRYRDHWLIVELEQRTAIVKAKIVIPVELQGHADERGNGVGQLFGDVAGGRWGRFLAAAVLPGSGFCGHCA